MENAKKIEPGCASGSPSEEYPNVTEYDRRQALAKMGKYAAYTAPALLVLLSAKASDAGEGCRVRHHPPRCDPSCPPGATLSNNCIAP